MLKYLSIQQIRNLSLDEFKHLVSLEHDNAFTQVISAHLDQFTLEFDEIAEERDNQEQYINELESDNERIQCELTGLLYELQEQAELSEKLSDMENALYEIYQLAKDFN